MGQLLGGMYCSIFEDFFGMPLADYLWGTSGAPQQSANMFFSIGLSMLGISMAICVLFYYVVNHPRLCNWWGWGIFCALNAVINFFVGWQWVLQDYYDGKMVAPNAATGQLVDMTISEGDITCFGVANMLLAIAWFFLFSFTIKWKSTNVAHAPF